MRLWRERPPEQVRARFERDERVLTWGRTEDGQPVVATQRGLWLPGRDRLGWHEIDRAAWDDGVLTLTPARVVDGVIEESPPQQWTLGQPGKLPQIVQRRVTASVAYTDHVDLPPRGGVRIVARRVSGRDGLRWAVRFDEGTDIAAVRHEAAVQLARAQERFKGPEIE